MGDSEMAPGARETDRRTLVRYLRRVNEQQEDAVDPIFDATQGEIQDDHRSFLETFLGMLPAGGRVLDAPCGTGKYFGLVLESGRTLLGVDHSGAHLASAARKFPTVPSEKHDLHDLPCRDEFDGVMCVDAMEMIPPEDWPVVLDRFRRALRPGGWLYLTVERVLPEDQVRRLDEEARRCGLPVVEREVISRPEDWLRAANEEHAPTPMSSTITTPPCSRSAHGLPTQASRSRTRPMGMGSTPITTCWPAWRPCLKGHSDTLRHPGALFLEQNAVPRSLWCQVVEEEVHAPRRVGAAFNRVGGALAQRWRHD